VNENNIVQHSTLIGTASHTAGAGSVNSPSCVSCN